MLVLIGMGLHDEKDLTLRGLEEARGCEVLFAELYTSTMPGLDLGRLEGLVGKKVEVLERADLEERTYRLLEKASKRRVGLFVIGDPLISTTHVHLRLEAQRLGIESRVVHNASISSAAPSVSGLQNYKFGRSATIALPEEGFFPETPYEAVRENKGRGLHTLLYLDIKVRGKERRMMTAGEGIETLLRIEERRREGVFTPETLCVALGRVGSPDCVMRAGMAGDLAGTDLGLTPHTLIVPGRLHFLEEEYLKTFGGS